MEEYYLDILNNHPDSIAYFDENGNILFYNKAFNSAYNLQKFYKKNITLKEIIFNNLKSGLINHHCETDDNFANKVITQFSFPSEKFFIEFLSGKIYEVFIKIGTNKKRIMYHNDITDLKRLLEVTSIKLDKLELIMETIFSGVISFNNNGKIDYYNKSAENIFSAEKNKVKLSSVNIEFLFEDISIKDILNQSKYGTIRELNGKRLNGESFPVEVIINKLNSKWSLLERRKESRENFIATLNDITESKKLAFELQQSQKMDAIGSLASGIAHDFNNILSIIIGSGSLLKSKDSSDLENINNIINAAQRAKNLIKQILNYSSPNKNKSDYLDLSKIVNEIASFIKQTIPSTININVSVGDKDAFMFGDETDIHRCILNLLTNSASAIGNSKGNIDIDLKVFKEEKIIKLKISDDGIGIKAEIKSRIFDPFFSTKDKSEGTGLGLSMVQRIIKDHKGQISFKSEYNNGSTFEIIFPLTNKNIINVEEKNNLKELSRGKIKGTIIFVDDEELIVKVSTKILTNAGYKVLGINNSIEALGVIQKNPEKFSLLITDQNMPNIKGIELAKEIRRNNIKLKIIICSGYSDGIDKSEIKDIGISKILSKPISSEELVKIVDKLLV